MKVQATSLLPSRDYTSALPAEAQHGAELRFVPPTRVPISFRSGRQRRFLPLLQGALDALPLDVLMLDEFGTIVVANAAWRRGAEMRGCAPENHGIGMPYLELYKAVAQSSAEVDVVRRGLHAVLARQFEEFVHEQEWNGDASRGCFRIRVSCLELQGIPHMIVSHQPLGEINQARQGLQQALAEIAGLKQRLCTERLYLQEEIRARSDFKEIVGQSASLYRIFHQMEQVASTASNVLVLGETGTGKELVARAIHGRSSRRHRPLVKVNCAALPSTLIESEFFGHEKGAFTGALTRKIGRFEVADGGTIFLDEIGDLALELQPKLLRVLQEGEFERIGSTSTLKVDVRVIAATNRKLDKEVAAGRFRSDLYYRLSVFPVELPPLRERREDIPLLVWYFIQKSQRKLAKSITAVPKKTMEALTAYAWPGNVRELENVIERAVILSPGATLHVDESFARSTPGRGSSVAVTSLEELQRAHIVRTLEACGGRIKGRGNAAERLGLNPSTLRSRIKKLGILGHTCDR